MSEEIDILFNQIYDELVTEDVGTAKVAAILTVAEVLHALLEHLRAESKKK